MPEPEPIGSVERDGAHSVSLAIWDLASPVVAGRRATLKVGLACSCGCDLTGTRIDAYDEAGATVGSATLGSVPWPATTALHWAELDVAAPDADGDHWWSLQTTVANDGRQASDPSHGPAASIVRFVASRPPEHRVTLQVIDKAGGAPLAGVELRLGPFRAATDQAGTAHVDVPGGAYEVCAWTIGYDLLARAAHVSGDTTVHLEMVAAQRPEQPYWM